MAAAVLRSMSVDVAMRRLQAIKGIGPTYATLVLQRSTGTTDAVTTHEPRTPSYVASLYGLPGEVATTEEITGIAESWRPFRIWAMVLIRVAGDRAGLPWARPEPPARRRT